MNIENENEKINSQEPEEVSTQPAAISDESTESTAAAQEKPEEKGEPKQPEESSPKKDEKNPGAVKSYFGSTKFKRGGISTAFTAGFLVIVVLINVLVGILGNHYPSMNLDLSKDNTNTLSEQANKIVDKVKEPVTISIMATEEQTKNDQILSDYGIKYSQVGTLAAKMAERNSNIKVQYIDLVKNPTFAKDYKSNELTQGDVLIKSDKRERIVVYTDLFNIQYSQDGSSATNYSLVDSALASGVNSVIADTLPVVAFDTGHSEQMDGTTYKQLLSNNSFEAKDFNLLTDAVPDKAQIIVLGCPTTDYTDEEIKKLDDFLSSTKLAGDRTLLITFTPSQTTMPKLSEFLQEWGIQSKQAVIVESDQSKYYANDPSYILSTVQSDLSLNGSSTDYGYFSTPVSVPLNLLYDTKGTKKTYVLAKSNTTSYAVDSKTTSASGLPKQAYDTAVLSQDSITSGSKTYKANVVALGSTAMFETSILGSSAFGNSKYVVDLTKYATGTSNADTAVTSTPVQTNVSDIKLTAQVSTILGLGVFTILIPLLIAIAGIVVFRKRRHL